MSHAKRSASGQFCLHAKVVSLVSWEENKKARLDEERWGEVRDMSWEAAGKKAMAMVVLLMIRLSRWKGKVKMCWELVEIALWLNIGCSSLGKVSISLLNLIISYGFGKWSQVVLNRCESYCICIYWTCFRRICLKTVMSLLFKFPFQNIFSELRQTTKINHKGLAETSMFSGRFAWLMIFPDRQSISWWKPGKTDHAIQNKLYCCVFKMLLLSNLIIRKKCQKLLCS